METSSATADALNGQAHRTFLLPVDDSQATESTTEWFIQNIYRPGDLVQVMHVVPVPVAEMATGVGFEYYPIVHEPDPLDDIHQVDAARKFLKRRALDKLTAAKVPFKVAIVHFLTDTSSIGEAICARADFLKADGVVMAKHQQGLLEKLFVGSVSNYCLKHCKQPLILLH